MNKYIIFDFDGVLCDSVSLAYQIHNSIAHKYNIPKINCTKEYLKLIDNFSIDKYLIKDEKQKYYKEHRDLMYEKRKKINLFQEVINLFQLSDNNLIIVSSTYEKLIKEILLKNNIKSKYIYGRETKGKKIDKINKILDMLNITKDDIIYMGDTLDDLNFCKKAKINMLASNYGYSDFTGVKSKYLKKIFDTPADMVKYISFNYKI